MTHDVFISYSTKNKTAAEDLVTGLEEAGISCWIAPRDCAPGIPYGASIIQAIEGCRLFVLLFSRDSNGSKQVLREVDHASSRDLDILPVLIEEVQPSGAMSYYLGPEQWFEAYREPFQDHLPDLSQAVKQLLGLKAEAGDIAQLTEQELPEPAEAPEEPPQQPAEVFRVKINPFTFGNPVTAPDRFYGRKDEIGQVVSRLLSAGESTSIVGERRIGKTSLLKYLTHPDVARQWGLPPEKFCLVYIDFQGRADITPERFWSRVLRKIERTVCKPDLVPRIQDFRQRKQFDLFDLEDLFEDISYEGLTTVLLMDEFEYVTRNPNFKSDFFGGLRALAIHRNVPLITGTRRELVDLCHSEEIKGSPFFNIFVNIVLRPFSQEDVSALLAGYLADTGVALTAEEQELVMRLGGGYPFFVQMAGHYLLEAKWDQETEEAVLKTATQNFDQQAEPHFQYFWSRSSESEKITLLTIIVLNEQEPDPETASTLENLAQIHSRSHLDLPELIKRGLLLQDPEQETYHLFSPRFVTWILREIAAVSGEEESRTSVEEWLRSHEHDQVEPLKGALPKFKKKYWPVVSSVLHEMTFELAGAATFELLIKALLKVF
jgi:hypothetical protein